MNAPGSDPDATSGALGRPDGQSSSDSASLGDPPPASLHLVPLMRKVENTAWKQVLRCLESERREALCLPVPIERWVEGPLNLRLEIADLSHLDHDGHTVLGATVVSTRTIRISDRVAEQENRFRFTVAHELGHISLHAHLSGKFRNSADGEFLADRYEREADRFAAAFLVPANAFRQEFPRYAASCGIEAREMLDRVSAEDPAATKVLLDDVLPRLSKRFGVASSTALGRLRDLQLDGNRAMVMHRILRKLHARLDSGRS